MSEISIRCLGSRGWFGNQLFQYAFAKSFAEKNNWHLRTPRWIGQEIFKDINDPLINLPHFPSLQEEMYGPAYTDLVGYFQTQEHIDFYNKEWCRKTFDLKEEYNQTELPHNGEYIACHLRHGDYRKYYNVYATIEKEAYENAIEEMGFPDLPVVFVQGNIPNKNYIQTSDYDTSFVDDFNILRNAPILLRSNSTFSWWAHVLGREDQEVYSPIVSHLTGSQSKVEFDYGNHQKFTHINPTEFRLNETANS